MKVKKPKTVSKPKEREKTSLEGLRHLRDWVSLYRTHLLYGGLGVVVLIIAATAVLWSRASSREEAALEELLARDAFSRGDYDSALTRAEAIIERYEGSYSAAVAWVIKGKVYEARGFFEPAKKAFERVIDKYGEHPYLAFGAYYALGNIAWGEGDFNRAAKYFEEGVRRYPKHFHAPNALVKAGDAMVRLQVDSKAKEFYRRVIENYPKSRAASRAREELARLEFVP